MRLPIYLDYLATTPVDIRVKEKMLKYFSCEDIFGNASSNHIYGLQAKNAVENARQQVAQLINAQHVTSIVWTSGATEANNLAIKGASLFYQRQGKHIITCQTEHKAVLACCRYLETLGFEITYLQPQSNGLIDLEQFKQALRNDTILASIMHVNNEIGVIQNIQAIGEITKERGILLHVDGAQSVGKIPVDVQAMNIDLLSFTAHKFYGPKGIGALYIRNNPRLHLMPQIHGGGQENNLRSGTLATHQIVGFGETCLIAEQEMLADSQRILKLRNLLLDGIVKLGNVCIHGDLEQRIAGNLNVSFYDLDAELLLPALKDIAISSGSACRSLSFEPSYVLLSLGAERELAGNSLRFSIGKYTTLEEIEYAIKHIRLVVERLRY